MEELFVFLERFCVAVFVVLADNLGEAAGRSRKLGPVAEGIINAEQIVDKDADSIRICREVADFEKNHLLAFRVGGVNHTQDVALESVRGFAAEAVDEGFHLTICIEFHGRNLAHRAVIHEILFGLLAFFDEGHPEAVVALEELIEGLRHQLRFETIVTGDGENDIDDTLEERIFGLKIDDVLRIVESEQDFVFMIYCHFFCKLLSILMSFLSMGDGSGHSRKIRCA